MNSYKLDITADERFMLISALAAVLAGGNLGERSGEWSTLARRLIDLSCQPSSSIQPAAPENVSPTVAPTRAPAPVAQTRGKDAGAGARDSSQWPKTIDQLNRAGYNLLAGSAAQCHYCGKTIEWWQTPNGKKIPLERAPGVNNLITHFATCPRADEARFPALRRAD